MAKIVGIIAEFNPFHNGHEYIIKKAKEITAADFVVIAMSGDYVQRGHCALTDKYSRTKMALLGGADAVFMLPSCISTGSAMYYAYGSVSLLNSLGVDYLFFGSEDGSLESINSKSFEKGNIDCPNNILATEYLNAIKNLNLNIKPFTTKRIGSNYNNTDSVIDGTCSASYIRKSISESQPVDTLMPPYAFSALNEYLLDNDYVYLNDFSDILLSKLLENEEKGFNSYFDIYDDLSKKIISKIYNFTNIEKLISELKSKDITYSHVCRALCHILINCKTDDIGLFKENNYSLYARLLGFKKESKDILKILQDRCTVPFISKLSEYKENVSKDVATLISKDIYASHIYSYIASKKHEVTHEFTKPLVII